MADPNTTFSVFSGPIPGQSLTHAPKSMPWETPPQHTKLEPTMEHLWDQLLQPQHMKELLRLMQMGLSVEEITRVILFSGFSMGKWTPDLGMLMYKPLMLLVAAIAHRAGLHDTPMVMKERLHQHMMDKVKNHVMLSQATGKKFTDTLPAETVLNEAPAKKGFMSNNG